MRPAPGCLRVERWNRRPVDRVEIFEPVTAVDEYGSVEFLLPTPSRLSFQRTEKKNEAAQEGPASFPR